MVPSRVARFRVKGETADRGFRCPAVQQDGSCDIGAPVGVPDGVHDAVSSGTEWEREARAERWGFWGGLTLPPEPVEHRQRGIPGSGLRPLDGRDKKLDLYGKPERAVAPFPKVEEFMGRYLDKQGG